MHFSLWSNGILLGHTTPAPGAHPSTQIFGFFHASAAFQSVGAPLLRLAEESQELTLGLGADLPSKASLSDLSDDERGLRIHHAMRASESARRLVELRQAVEALPLELRDERGIGVRADGIYVYRIPVTPHMIAPIRDSAAGWDVEFSDLMLVATKVPDDAVEER